MEGEGATPSARLLQAELSRATTATYELFPGGDIPSPEVQSYRERYEAALTAQEKEDTAFSCLLLAKRRMETHRDVFRQVIQQTSPEMGMREDDVLVAILHNIWAGCYSRSLAQSPVPGISLLSLPPEQKEALLEPLKQPMAFSEQTLESIDAFIQRFAAGRPPVGSFSSLFTAYFFSVAPILFILGFLVLLLFLFQRLFSGIKVPQKLKAGEEGAPMKKHSHTGTEVRQPEDGCMACASKEDEQQETTTRRRMSAGSQKGPPPGAARGGPMRSS